MFILLATASLLATAPPDDVPRHLPALAPILASAPGATDGEVSVRAIVEPPSQPTSRTVRVISEVLVAGAAGTLTGALGGYLGCLGSLSARNTCSDGTVAAGALSGFGLAVAAMVPLTGSYFEAHGSPWVAWFGEALGAGTALAIGQGSSGRLLWVAPPLMLAGAVLGYELSSSAAAATPRRGSVGLVSIAPTLGPDGRTGLVVAGRF
jgi:hypothetical protein